MTRARHDFEALVARLEGHYSIPVNDGAGLLDGKATFDRDFDTPPIQHEAAAALRELAEERDAANEASAKAALELEHLDADCVDLILERDGIKHSRVCRNNVASPAMADIDPCLRCQRDEARDACYRWSVKASNAINDAAEARAQLARLREACVEPNIITEEMKCLLCERRTPIYITTVDARHAQHAPACPLAACDAKEDNPCK